MVTVLHPQLGEAKQCTVMDGVCAAKLILAT